MPTVHFVSRTFLRKNGLQLLQWDPMGSTKRPNQHLSCTDKQKSLAIYASSDDGRLRTEQRIEAPHSSCEKHSGVNSGKKRKAVAEERMTKKICDHFSDRVTDLKAYQEKHGNLNVRIKDDKSLAYFCINIRHARKHMGESGVMKLTKERISSLDAIGFDWKLDDASGVGKKFSNRVADLKAYKEKYGHTNVRIKDDKSLAYFCNNIRWARKHMAESGMKLTNERISSLDAIGFDWKLDDDSGVCKKFSDRVAGLKAYKEKHGHVNVRIKDDKSLYNFCKNIRQARKHMGESGVMKLTNERISSLDSIGFDWKLDDASCVGNGKKQEKITTKFSNRVADLKAYQEKHGHINVRIKDDKSLYYFCSNIRHARKHMGEYGVKLTNERISSLDAIGFDWKLDNVSGVGKKFSDQVADLKAYQEKHGHVNVRIKDDKSLAYFCINIRHARKHMGESGVMKLTKERISSLDAIGFDWKLDDASGVGKKFSNRVADLKAYKEKYGHTNVRIKDDKSLYYFCNDIRYARKNTGKSGVRKLTNERIAYLDALGFEWSQKDNNSVEEKIEALKAYKRKHGHLNVKRSEDPSLFYFCINVRNAHRNQGSGMKLTEKRIASLDALNFQWGVKKSSKHPQVEPCSEDDEEIHS
ncbi:hypothetical protein ACHAXR_012392 [Thalassiosira sp. AJA248-18]